MINEKEGTIIVTDENNNQIKVQIIFGFSVPEYNKNYIEYTTESDLDQEEINILISEYDGNTYEIKSIPEEEMEKVLDFYNSAKEMILSD